MSSNILKDNNSMDSNKVIKYCEDKYCNKNCAQILTHSLMQSINKSFTELKYEQKRKFVFDNTKRILNERVDWCSSDKTFEFKYYLNNNEVCRKTFLGVLGLKGPNMIINIYRNLESNQINSNSFTSIIPTKRGKHKRGHSLTFKQNLENFVQLFKPHVSHYSYEKTKLLYIENETFVSLYEKFENYMKFEPNYGTAESEHTFKTVINKNNIEFCTYNYFKSQLKDRNISISI
jgi:hypothetical protein